VGADAANGAGAADGSDGAGAALTGTGGAGAKAPVTLVPGHCPLRALISASRASGPRSRAAAGSGAGAGAAASARNASPHSMQRNASKSLGVPQAAQVRRGNAVPQWLQNRAPASLS
jgi:hypothetical protein